LPSWSEFLLDEELLKEFSWCYLNS
jgi:hypothetical protein